MRVVSFMNYKGGVGKTTIAANLGAGLAQRGKRVLMLDLDPQTNLTFSFYNHEQWENEITSDRSIKKWFDAHLADHNHVPKLSELIVTPSLNGLLTSGGQLDLISSDLQLLDIDMRLAAKLYASDQHQLKAQRLKLHRMLADALEDEDIVTYDYVLIDCAPDFGIVTRVAMIASDYLLVPAKPDRLSTLGISHFVGSLEKLVREHNSLGQTVPHINPRLLGVVFTMINTYGGKPIFAHQAIMAATANEQLPVFRTTLRNASRMAISSAESGIPAVLSPVTDSEIVNEFQALTEEFTNRIEQMR